MRVAIASIMQEVNAFNSVLTTVEDFRSQGVSTGDEIIRRFTGASLAEVAGFVSAAEARADIELVPTVWAFAVPGGPCDEATHRWLRAELAAELASAAPFDAILLALHGSLSAVDEPDVEGAMLTDIRAAYGHDMPVVISLDHHGNVTRRMVQSVDAVVAYKTQPHVDHVATGAKAAGILYDTLAGRCKPTVRHCRIPLIAAGNMLTKGGPLGEMMARAAELEHDAGALDISICPGFPWATSPELGWHVLVTTDDAPELAQQLADQLAAEIWPHRERFVRDEGKLPPAAAVEQALATEHGPVILSDAADSPNSGAPGDSTAILKELLGKELGGYALLTIVDPEAVAACIAAGIGSELTLAVGGKRDGINTPATVTGVVKTISDGRYLTYEAGGKRLTMSTQRTVVLEVGDVFIVLSESRGWGHMPELYRQLGLEPADARVVVVKSPYLFRESYADIAASVILVDAPGVRSSHLPAIADRYGSPPRPLYPLDPDMGFRPHHPSTP
jgi:microcystin degradation protein MlrC